MLSTAPAGGSAVKVVVNVAQGLPAASCKPLGPPAMVTVSVPAANNPVVAMKVNDVSGGAPAAVFSTNEPRTMSPDGAGKGDIRCSYIKAECRGIEGFVEGDGEARGRGREAADRQTARQ